MTADPAMALPELAVQAIEVVRTVIAEIRPRLIDAALAADPGTRVNTRHADNFLSVHDLWLHERYRDLLRERLDRFVYASEEADPAVLGDDPDPDLCVLVDPLDTSELAVRGLHGYTHLLIYSRRRRRPLVAVVGDIYHHVQLYVAARHSDGVDRAWLLTADGQRHSLIAGRDVPLARALVTNYLMRPGERFAPLADQQGLLRALGQPDADGRRRGRIGVDFGSVGLCHVAAGFTDAMVEFAKGFAVWDLAPGHYILHAAGGTIIDLDGRPLPLDHRLDTIDSITTAMAGRQRFIAATGDKLANEIAETLRSPSRPEGIDPRGV